MDSSANRKNDIAPRTLHGRAIKQKRGHTTYLALINAGFRLLEEKDLDNISIAELSKKAGYTVGSFYARFDSKDQFFDALVAYHLEQRTRTLDLLYEKYPPEKLPSHLVKNIIDYYMAHRRFWRACQMRNVRDPEFARKFRENFSNRSQKFTTYMESQLRRSLTKTEKADINFAFQILMGTVNNAAFNESGPILLGQKLYIKEMQRTFVLVSGIDKLFAEMTDGKNK